MTPRQFCQSGTGERVKLAVHGLMLVGCACCAVYNAAAWWYRREKHNAVNAVVYTGGVILEGKHVCGHWSRSLAGTAER